MPALSLPLVAMLGGVCVLGVGGPAPIGPSAAVAAPQPDPIPRRWQLDIEAGSLRCENVRLASGEYQSFYFMTYKVTNRTGKDLYLAPLWELATDEGTIQRSGRDVPPEVYEQLLDRLRNPFLQDEIDIQGTIASGRENAREGLVVWRAEDLAIDEVSIFGAGFSGETRSYTRPDNGEKVVLRKTYMLKHLVPGELEPATRPTIERVDTRWTLR